MGHFGPQRLRHFTLIWGEVVPLLKMYKENSVLFRHKSISCKCSLGQKWSPDNIFYIILQAFKHKGCIFSHTTLYLHMQLQPITPHPYPIPKQISHIHTFIMYYISQYEITITSKKNDKMPCFYI